MKFLTGIIENIKVVITSIVAIIVGTFSFGTYLGNIKADIKIAAEQNKSTASINECNFEKQKLELKIINLENENRWLKIAKMDLKSYIQLQQEIENNPTEENFQKYDKLQSKVDKIIK